MISEDHKAKLKAGREKSRQLKLAKKQAELNPNEISATQNNPYTKPTTTIPGDVI